MNKYGAVKTVIDGIRFDSKHEAERYCELKFLERIKAITNLQFQRKYTLIGPQRDENGKVIEKAVIYKADFVYEDAEGNTVVEDAKGVRTPVYKIKKKLMLSIYGIRIKEV